MNSFNGTNTIPKDPSRDDINFYAVHVICDDCSVLPSKENQIPFWMNCNHCVVVNTIHETKFNINPFKQDHVLTICFNVQLLVP
jgi:uncharacterized protein (DUF169 family)